MLLSFLQFEISFGDTKTMSLQELLKSPILIGSIIGIIVLFVLLKFSLKWFRNISALPVAFNKVLLLVTLPKQVSDLKSIDKEKSEMSLNKIQEAIGIMESFYNSIAGLKAQRGLKHFFKGRSDHFSFEIVSHDNTIAFYVSIDRSSQNYIEQHIQAQFPNAYIEEVEDYNIFKPQSYTAAAAIKLKRYSFFPIKTYKKFNSDPLNSLTNILSKIDKEDGAVIQILARSARSEWHDDGIEFASVVKQGKKPKDILNDLNRSIFTKVVFGLGGFLKDAVTTKKDAGMEGDKKYILSSLEEEMIKGLEEKSSKLGMDIVIRVVTSSVTKMKAQMYLDNVLNSFTQYSIYEYGNSFKSVIPKKKDDFIHDFIYRIFDDSLSSVLNTEELSSVFHFPLPSLETPKILWLLSKKAPTPENMSKEGPILGDNFYRGKKVEVRINPVDRRRHMYILGTTGTGKSTLAVNVCAQDILEGRGCCYIDPHGDDVENLLSIVPKERAKDVIVFDPGDSERPLALNLLEYTTEEEKTFVINEMINIFDKLYDLSKSGGPRFEQYMRNAMLLVMSDPASGSTLMEVPRVLADANFRKYKLKKCQNIIVRDFWMKEAEKAGGEASLANMTTYITSKLTPFISNDLMRPIIAQQQSSLDFRDIMDNKKILLIKLSKGKIGEMNMKLLGMIIVGKILVASLGRVDMPSDKRHDFYLYIDEFQNFVTDSIAIILSEARKYKLNLILAHQYISQLVKDNDTKVKDAVFGNVGSFCCFRIGVEDIETMTKQFAPVFNDFDLLNCPARTCYAKLMVDNANPPPFNMSTRPPIHLKMANPKVSEAIRQASRLKYGRNKKIIEAELKDRVRKVDLLASGL